MERKQEESEKERMRLAVLSLLFLITTVAVQAQTVYVTKTGEKYHREACHYLKQSKRTITLEKALELRYKPCSVCKPDIKLNKKQVAQSDKPKPAPDKKATATQCTGKTNAGKRCKRMTKNTSGRCYQHE